MSYLPDKIIDRKNGKKKYRNIAIGVVVLLFVIYFRAGIFRVLSVVGHTMFRPVLVVGNSIGGKFSGLSYLLSSKKSLEDENNNLKADLDIKNATLSNYNSILDDNNKMKDILGRKNEKTSMVIAGILAKPNHSLYDTLLIDAGSNQGIAVGARVYAEGDVPIGRVAEVFASSSNVILFSNPGEKTEGVISGKDAFIELIGRGGGNFEIILPRDFNPEKGTEVDLPGIKSYVLGIVQTIISDPRDSFVKALVISPVNIQELKFVEVEQ